MTIDVNLIRAEKGGDVEAVRASELKRGRDDKNLETAIALDQEWRQIMFQVDQLKRKQNALAKEVATRKKADGKDADVSDIMKESLEVKKQIPEMERKAEEVSERRNAALRKIGNLVHESVVPSDYEVNNAVIRTWGPSREELEAKGKAEARLPHYEVLAKLEGVEMKKAAEVAGHRAYYLKGYGALLNQALVQYGLAFLRRREYCPVQPPFFMKREWMARAAELADFNETLYQIPKPAEAGAAKAEAAASPEDLFLIATSEQPLCALHANDYVEEKSLPLKYAGISTCFRREAGSHGKDMRGIFRIHQFEKVEQFIICTPDNSWKHHEEMIKCSEEFYQSLNLPYRVVSIVAGALNDAAARKFDLEAWFHSYADYRELVSCSNCTDFQARDLNIRLGAPKMNERTKEFVHMLNGTLCATERTMCCLLEHYQEEGGVRVPEVLRPFMDGLEFLPYKC